MCDRMDEIDTQLKAAGAAWRASKPAEFDSRPVVPLPITSPVQEQKRDRRRWLLPAAAAATVLLITLASAVTLQLLKSNTKPGHHDGATSDFAALIVRVGDPIQAIGQVFRSAHGAQLCGAVFTTGLGGSTTQPVPFADCKSQHVADLAGVDVDAQGIRVSGSSGPAVSGFVHLTGVLVDSGTINVTAVSNTTRPADDLRPTPCEAPPSGWQSPTGQAGGFDTDVAKQYVSA